jgi:predicted glycosyltransferase
LTIWIDIDNPPQSRYLLPFVGRFEDAGHDVLVTARAYGETLSILRAENALFEPVGSTFGKSPIRKVYGSMRRARQLAELLRRRQVRVDLVLTGSRSATLAARRLGIPSFVIVDYEYVNLLFYRLSASHIVHPSVIEPRFFEQRGVPRHRLLPFDGLKEDISFADVDLSAVSPHDFGRDEGAVRILFRPPAEESHYYRSESRDLALEALRYLATQQAQIVFSPRQDRQIEYLDVVTDWHQEPIVLRKSLPFVSLLKAVDAVVSAGGTMLREAAYLGVPAYSIFQGKIGAVDRYLASIARLTIVDSPSDLSRIAVKRSTSSDPLRKQSHVAQDVTNLILEQSEETHAANDGVRRTRTSARRL